MPYEVLEKKIKSLPEKYYPRIDEFVNSIMYEARVQKMSEREITEKLNKIYSHASEKEQTFACDAALESFRELTKNDSW